MGHTFREPHRCLHLPPFARRPLSPDTPCPRANKLSAIKAHRSRRAIGLTRLQQMHSLAGQVATDGAFDKTRQDQARYPIRTVPTYLLDPSPEPFLILKLPSSLLQNLFPSLALALVLRLLSSIPSTHPPILPSPIHPSHLAVPTRAPLPTSTAHDSKPI